MHSWFLFIANYRVQVCQDSLVEECKEVIEDVCRDVSDQTCQQVIEFVTMLNNVKTLSVSGFFSDSYFIMIV